nr:serine hydrolase [bacterium]
MPGTHDLPHASLAALGIPYKAAHALLDAMDKHEFHTFVVTRHGKVAMEGAYAPYPMEASRLVYSCSKNFLATAIGLAIGEGLFKLEDRILDLLPEYAPEHPSPYQQQLTVHDLLCMASGHEKDTSGQALSTPGADPVRTFFAIPIAYPPGTHFVYHTTATYVLSHLLQKLSGQNAHAYLKPRLFDKLGITGTQWQQSAMGVDIGGSGLHVSADGLARLALLYAQDGVWQGERILSHDWVERATKKQVENFAANHVTHSDGQAWDWAQGYGYQFWRCRHNGYRGDGAYGQFNMVFPDQHLTFSSTGQLPAVMDMQRFLDDFYANFLLALSDTPLAEDTAAQADVDARTGALALPVCGQTQSPAFPFIDGAVYRLEKNALGLTSLSVASQGDGLVLRLGDAGGGHTLAVGVGSWAQTLQGWPIGAGTLYARAAWESVYRLAVHLRAWGSVQSTVLRLTFTDNRVQVEAVSTEHRLPNGQALGVREG